jgi:oligopeptidase B
MKYFLSTIGLSLLLVNCSTNESSEENASTMNSTKPTPPVCAIKPKELTAHGQTRIDNYFWLNDRTNPEVISYLEAENAYTKEVLKPTEKFQEELFNEMKARIKEQDESVPYFYNEYHYRTKFIVGGEYPIYVRSKNADFSQEEVLLDGNAMGKGLEYFSFGGYDISPDNTTLAYTFDTVSRRMYDLRFKNLTTGELYPEVIKNTDGGVTWANDNKTVFYGVQDPETLRSYRIMKHILGTPAEQDVVVFEEKDETFSTFIYKSNSEKYLIIGSGSTMTDEYQILEADNPSGKFRIFQKRVRGLEYSISHQNDKFYVNTNKDSATNFKLMECPENKTDKANWKEVIAHRSETLIEDVSSFENHIILTERTNGLIKLRVIEQKTKKDYYIPFNDESYVAYASTNAEYSTTKFRYYYTSLTTPGTTYDFDLEKGTQETLKQQEVVGGYDPEQYESKRVFVTARDGVKVPMSIVYKKTTKLDGSAPLLQYAYGSYGYSIDPTFSSTRLSLLDRGFVFVICHIRGGEELGREWYESGKLLEKMNTFNDFIDCSIYLTENKYTSTDKLFAMGGSAGGLLMGAIVNMRPDLYKGIIAAVPFVDVVTTMLDSSIPLTTGEYDEWGNPNEKESYDYMLSYSPYDNVKAQAYPNMMVTTGLHDSQVQYWEPAKWVAKLRVTKTDDNLLLLHTNMSAGHGGASGRFEYLKEIAMEYAFMMHLLGVEK